LELGRKLYFEGVSRPLAFFAQKPRAGESAESARGMEAAHFLRALLHLVAGVADRERI